MVNLYGLYMAVVFLWRFTLRLNGIPHTKSIKRVCLLNQQSDVEFARPVDK